MELEQELGSGAKEDPDAGKQWMQEKELEAARAGAMEFQTEDELIQALSNDGVRLSAGRLGVPLILPLCPPPLLSRFSLRSSMPNCTTPIS